MASGVRFQQKRSALDSDCPAVPGGPRGRACEGLDDRRLRRAHLQRCKALLRLSRIVRMTLHLNEAPPSSPPVFCFSLAVITPDLGDLGNFRRSCSGSLIIMMRCSGMHDSTAELNPGKPSQQSWPQTCACMAWQCLARECCARMCMSYREREIRSLLGTLPGPPFRGVVTEIGVGIPLRE